MDKALEGDCNDQDNTVYDGAEEICDGQTNDCMGAIMQSTDLPEGEEDDDQDGLQCVQETVMMLIQ